MYKVYSFKEFKLSDAKSDCEYTFDYDKKLIYEDYVEDRHDEDVEMEERSREDEMERYFDNVDSMFEGMD